MRTNTLINVLLADDETPLRQLVRRFLSDTRFNVIEADNGKTALDAVDDACALDLLITDEMMPEMQGHELARRLRQQNPDLKVLYLTGYADHLFKEKEQLWDREAYLDKPFSQQALNEAVALLMTGRLTFTT